jgi:hypothetical protein
MVMALPILRIIRRDLQKPKLYDETAASAPQGIYVNEVVKLMDLVQKAMLQLFDNRFDEINSDIGWVSMLDPRYATMTCLSESERELVKERLVNATVEKARMQRPSSPPVRQDDHDESGHHLTPVSTDVRYLQARMQGLDDIDSLDTLGFLAEDTDTMLRIECDDEVARYIRRAQEKHAQYIMARKNKVNPSEELENEMRMGPLEWWMKYGTLFPRMRKLARKWLVCVATSVPSERAFSSSGYVVSARRSRLAPKFVEDLLMFIAHNSEYKESSDDTEPQ